MWVSTVKLAAVSNRISECRVIPSARLAVTNTPMRLWAVGEELMKPKGKTAKLIGTHTASGGCCYKIVRNRREALDIIEFVMAT